MTVTSTEELVVLLDDDGQPIGTADKATIHGRDTPLHLAFSFYGFGDDGRILLTQRALTKRTFPALWSNTCCGHPSPGEALDDAVRRRLREELGLDAVSLELVLPAFRYRATMDGIVENEVCPVFVGRIGGEPTANPDEVHATRWQSWDGYVRDALADGTRISPWSQLQVRELEAGGHVAALIAGVAGRLEDAGATTER